MLRYMGASVVAISQSELDTNRLILVFRKPG